MFAQTILSYVHVLGLETVPYPPAHGDFAVYTINDLENGINYAVSGVNINYTKFKKPEIF